MAYTGEQKREYQREWIARRRRTWVQANGPCQQCGSWDELEVDHLDPDSKACDPSWLWSLALTNPARVAELAKCQVLCRPCHEKKTHKERAYAHGTNTGYSRGCRCRPCTDAHAALAREYRSRASKGLDGFDGE